MKTIVLQSSCLSPSSFFFLASKATTPKGVGHTRKHHGQPSPVCEVRNETEGVGGWAAKAEGDSFGLHDQTLGRD